MARTPRKPSKEAVKRAADRAEARSIGDEEALEATAEKTPLDPPVVMAKMGRPTKYKPEYAQQAEKLCLLGATDADIADFFKVHIRTIERWRSEHEDFCRSIKDAKDIADQRVERSLYQRAIGYETEAVKIFNNNGAEMLVPYRERVQPDVTAAIFWLKNRKSDVWKDRKSVETRDLTEEDGLKGDVEAARKVAFMLGRAVGRAEKTETTEKHVDAEPDSAA